MTYCPIRRIAALLAAIVFLQGFIFSQNFSGSGAALNRPSTSGVDPSGSYTAVREPNLIGMYRPDGSFRSVSSPTQLATLQPAPDVPNQTNVPSRFLTRSNEDVVENLIPPARANQLVRGHSPFALLRDNIIRFAYGNARVLNTPSHVVTDSRGRLIVADPHLAAVHVLDSSTNRSFRIAAGPWRRLQDPGAIALDSEDNIYVADRKLGLVGVFDPTGKFLRYIGDVQGESMFDTPTGIAIDKKSRRLYVLDGTASELVVFDLSGKVLKRVGGERSQANARLHHPTEIVVWKDEVLVLDRDSSRVQIFDLDCNAKNSFSLRSENAPPVRQEVGLAVDSQAQIYISNLTSSGVRVYAHSGEFLGYMGRNGIGQTFNVPLSLWVDASDRLYVTDSNYGRIQVFQLGSARAPIPGVAR